jgi:hypothetical protein
VKNPYERSSIAVWFSAVWNFVGHMVGAALMFAGVAAIAWGLGWFVSWLHAMHKFPEFVYQFLHFIEYALLAVDTLVLLFLVCFGAIKFVREIRSTH